MIHELNISQALDNINEKLDRLNKLTLSKERPFISISEASDYLQLPKATLYSYTSRGIIPYHKLNDRRVYFSIEDLNEFILNKKNRYKSNSEIEAEAATRVVTRKGAK